MKKLSNLLIALTFLSVSFIACEEDPITPDPTGPTIAFAAGAGTVEGPTDVAVNTEFIVTVLTVAGDASINQIVVEEDGAAIDASRVTLEGNTAGSNPSPIDVTTFGNGFNWAVGITTSDAADVTRTYTIRVTDENGLSDELSVDITQIVSVSEMTVVLLKNQAGPVKTGGVDLNTGESTGTQEVRDPNTNEIVDDSYLTADLRDMGIDINLPTADNWVQKVGVINNSQLAVPAAGFDYASITSATQIIAAFEAGTEITESEKVETGNAFIVKNGTEYFAVLVTNVVVDAAGNDDYYELSVKQ